jgi:hypothetical protein
MNERGGGDVWERLMLALRYVLSSSTTDGMQAWSPELCGSRLSPVSALHWVALYGWVSLM